MNRQKRVIKTIADRFFALILLIISLPLLIIIIFLIALTDGFPVLFVQERVGEKWGRFKMIKFRTIKKSSNKYTIGAANQRTTIKFGNLLRRSHLDELPQLINILSGKMSFVGPRPEIRNIALQYDRKSKKIFQYLPGLTSPATIAFSDEDQMMKNVKDKESYYLKKIVPKKIAIDLDYFSRETLIDDLAIMVKTIFR